MQTPIITNIDAHFRLVSAFLHSFYAGFRTNCPPCHHRTGAVGNIGTSSANKGGISFGQDDGSGQNLPKSAIFGGFKGGNGTFWGILGYLRRFFARH